jgi:hypothetical protein
LKESERKAEIIKGIKDSQLTVKAVSLWNTSWPSGYSSSSGKWYFHWILALTLKCSSKNRVKHSGLLESLA